MIKDIGEKNIVRQYSELALSMLDKLNEFRKETHAMMSEPGPRYDPDKKIAECDRRHTVIKRNLKKVMLGC